MAKKELKTIADDIEALDDVLAGALTKFGSLGKAGNKQWTVFARIASGSLLWKIQARLRAVMNVAELITDGQKKQNKEMLETFKMQKKLADSTKNITASFNLFKAALILGSGENLVGDEVYDGLFAKHKDEAIAIKEGIALYTDLAKKAQRAQDIVDQGGHLKYYGNMAKQYMKDAPGNIGAGLEPDRRNDFKKGNNIIDYKSSFMGTAKDSVKVPKSLRWMHKQSKELIKYAKRNDKKQAFMQRATEIGDAIGKKAAAGWKNFKGMFRLIPKLAGLSLAALGTFAMYGAVVLIGIIVMVAIIKKAWPILSGMMTKFNDSLKITEIFFSGVMSVLYGVWDLLTAIWEGDIIGAIDALVFGIMWGLVKMSTSILLGIGALLISLAVSIVGGIVTGLYDVLKNTVLKRLPGFANGGITPGGPVVVGERGPEIVSLPKGSRVHPNGTGPGGNAIHIHINGRLGASDSEIRDIANKVAREINLRMNTRGTMTMGG